MKVVHGSVNAAVEDVLKYCRLNISSQVDQMRSDIQRCGESRVGCEELALLCPDEVSGSQELVGIAQIAEWEQWTFEYLPDGSVCFTPLEQTPPQI